MHVLLRVMAGKFTVAAALELFLGRSGMCSGLFALFWRLPVSEASVPFICQWKRVNWRTELNWSGLHWDCVWMRVVCACLYLYIDRCVCVCDRDVVSPKIFPPLEKHLPSRKNSQSCGLLHPVRLHSANRRTEILYWPNVGLFIKCTCVSTWQNLL